MKAAIICLFLIAALAGHSQGFIDYEAVSRDYPEKCGLQQKFDERFEQLQDSCNRIVEKFEASVQSLIPHHRTPSKAEETAFNDSLNAMTLAVQNLQCFAQGQLTGMQQAMNEQVREGLREELRRFCRSQNLCFLSEQKAILHGPGEPDYTAAFIAFLSTKK